MNGQKKKIKAAAIFRRSPATANFAHPFFYAIRCKTLISDGTFTYAGSLVGGKRLDILTLDGLGCPVFPQDPELVLSSTSRDKKVL